MGWSRFGNQAEKRAVNTYSNLLEEEVMEAIPPMETTFNKDKLQTLQSIFPDIQLEILEDVLGTANYDINAAAEMMAEISGLSPEVQGRELIDKEHAKIFESDGFKIECEKEGYQWINADDDWEMVETRKAPTKTFAEIIQSSKPPLALTIGTERIITTPATGEYCRKMQEKYLIPESNSFDDKWTIKSFGARKRQNMRKMRKMKTKQPA
uniref:AlNc14C135G7075 protein n=1 Tax=Albugo laibachii Nc14 TaxID=890382 RepID=F0W6J3_9STRA|nr:AlNc14C25G2483 [Albugo laibachii Nc14]CCA21841.1 AlNc14C135G7075 [Albugo laibachii Nc14]|eukprot:CCA21841.1 AlNc14C135G7075 [Albugo laibachii Nc14]